LAGDTAELERIWLGLRTAEGLDRGTLDDGQRSLAGEWERAGWAVADPERLRLTVDGWLLLDRLAVELDAAGTRVA
jgi:hypothetical protein